MGAGEMRVNIDPSPLPWSIKYDKDGAPVIVDKNMNHVAYPALCREEANARLIVAAVNGQATVSHAHTVEKSSIGGANVPS